MTLYARFIYVMTCSRVAVTCLNGGTCVVVDEMTGEYYCCCADGTSLDYYNNVTMTHHYFIRILSGLLGTVMGHSVFETFRFFWQPL